MQKIILNLIDDKLDLENITRQKDIVIYDLQKKLSIYEGGNYNVRRA